MAEAALLDATNINLRIKQFFQAVRAAHTDHGVAGGIVNAVKHLILVATSAATKIML